MSQQRLACSYLEVRSALAMALAGHLGGAAIMLPKALACGHDQQSPVAAGLIP